MPGARIPQSSPVRKARSPLDTVLARRFHLDGMGAEEIPSPCPARARYSSSQGRRRLPLGRPHHRRLLRSLFAASDVVTLGHEVSGVIHSRGPGPRRDLTVGTRVTLEAGQSCETCEDCARRRPCSQMRTRGLDYDGGWAQYTVAREDTLVPTPDDHPFDQAAIIPDAVSTPYAAVVSTAGVRPAQSVGVWGVGGVGAHNVRGRRRRGGPPAGAQDRRPDPPHPRPLTQTGAARRTPAKRGR
jgi:hypothetical protein